MHPDLGGCLWYEGLGPRSRAPLAGEGEVDVAIIGAGYTGLWTAYFLLLLKPDLSVALLDAEHVGFGASGRNGGWLMGNIEGLDDYLRHCDPATREQACGEVHGIVANAGDVMRREGIDCDFAHGGGIYAAVRYPQQQAFAEAHLRQLRAAGHSEADYHWLDQHSLEQRVRLSGGSAGIYTPHIAAIQPARLVHGLAAAVERQGAGIYESSPVVNWQPGRVETAAARLRARYVVQATEGFSRDIATLRPYLLPFQSGMVATEPLAADMWQAIGLEKREVLCDYSRLSTYLQRTADDRLVFGARGSYRFGGRPVSRFDAEDPAFAERRALARAFFPQLRDVAFTHAWGGTLGIPRRMAPHVVIDETAAYATAGGYVGEGVGAAFLFGRTLAELLLGRETARTGMPWVFRSEVPSALRRWEPEPLRWLGFRLLWSVFGWEEAMYRRGSAPAWRMKLARRVADQVERLL